MTSLPMNPHIPQLKSDKDNYAQWKQRVICELGMAACAGTYARASLTTDELREEDKKARYLILRYVSGRYFDIAHTGTSAKQVFEKLDEIFVSTATANLARLENDFCQLKMQPNESIEDYFFRGKAICDNMKLSGSVTDEAKLVRRLLSGLPKRYEAIREVMLSELNTPSFTNAMQRLVVAEQRFAQDEEGVTALLSKTHINSQKNKSNGKHQQNRQKNQQYRKKGDCFNCGKPGHHAHECWFPKKKTREAHVAAEGGNR